MGASPVHESTRLIPFMYDSFERMHTIVTTIAAGKSFPFTIARTGIFTIVINNNIFFFVETNLIRYTAIMQRWLIFWLIPMI